MFEISTTRSPLISTTNPSPLLSSTPSRLLPNPHRTPDELASRAPAAPRTGRRAGAEAGFRPNAAWKSKRTPAALPVLTKAHLVVGWDSQI
jgi:hypothetical protein